MKTSKKATFCPVSTRKKPKVTPGRSKLSTSKLRFEPLEERALLTASGGASSNIDRGLFEGAVSSAGAAVVMNVMKDKRSATQQVGSDQNADVQTESGTGLAQPTFTNETKPKSRTNRDSSKSAWKNKASTCASIFFLLISFVSWAVLIGRNDDPQDSQVTATTTFQTKAENDRSPASPSANGTAFKNIEDIQLGDRTLAKNPQGVLLSETDDSVFERFPHYAYSLCYIKEDGSRCDVKLLRPENWLDDEEIRFRNRSTGKIWDELDFQTAELTSSSFEFGLLSLDDFDVEVWLELPEMGVVGWSSLLDVDDDVTIRSGEGNVVTGTFAHVSNNIIDLQIEGSSKPITCTSNHPIWSVDRQDFVPAGNLLEGERLQLYSGETKRVAQKLPRPGSQTV